METKQTLPKSLDDCLIQDPVTVRLKKIASVLNVIGKVLFWIVTVGGSLASIITAIALEDGIPLLFVPAAVLQGFITLGIFKLVALLFESLGCIVQNTKTNADVALLQAAGAGSVNSAAKEACVGEWRCTCGNINKDYVSSCSCGRNKREVLSSQSQV